MPTDFSTKTLSAVEVPNKTILYPAAQARPAVGREEQVYAAVAGRIVSALQATAALPMPSSIIIGRYSQADYSAFLATGSYGISIWPVSERNTSRFWPTWSAAPGGMSPLPTPAPGTLTMQGAVAPLTAANSDRPGTITLSGGVGSGISIILLVGNRYVGASGSILTTASDTLDTIAASIAARITALGGTASAAGAIVTMNTSVTIRIASPVRRMREIERIAQNVQISVWSGSRGLRALIGDAIRSYIGSVTTEWLDIGDGTSAWCKQVSHRLLDDDEIDSLWVYHLIVSIEYGIMEIQTAYPILAASVSIANATLSI